MTPASVDIVIVTYNTREELAACLASLAQHPPTGLKRIHVVDNNSTDGTAAWAREHAPQVTLVALERNMGFAAANNIAIRQSTADLVLLLNSDTVVGPGAIDRLVSRLESTGAVAAGPRLVDAEGHPEISFGPMLTPIGEWQQRRWVRRAASDAPADRARVAAHLREEQTVDWVSGACLLVRREAALAAGLLDERYFMYEEDVDFCAALRARGGRVLFTPAAEVVHLRGRAIRRSGQAPTAHYDRSHLLFYEKHTPWLAPVLRVWLRLRGRLEG
jgi:hypothetical protein